MAQRRRRQRRNRRRHIIDDQVSRRDASRPASEGAADGLLTKMLGTVAIVIVGSVRLAEAVLTTAVHGAVNILREAVDGVRGIGSDVMEGRRPGSAASSRASNRQRTAREAA